jgi:CBS-domain-containing membrane protein
VPKPARITVFFDPNGDQAMPMRGSGRNAAGFAANGELAIVGVEASGSPRVQTLRSEEEVLVESVMTANAITVQPHDTMERAAVLMRRERIGALPVVHRGELRGIVTRTDVLRAYVALASYSRKAKISDAWEGTYLQPPPSRYTQR